MCVFVHMGGESVYDGERGYTKQQTYSCRLRVMSVLRYSLATTLSGEQKVYGHSASQNFIRNGS